jgi:hypothetical protein
MEPETLTIDKCRTCFWQGTPYCPRKDWLTDADIECSDFLVIDADEPDD